MKTIGYFINKPKFATALLILLFLSSTIFALDIQPSQAQPATQQPSIAVPAGVTPEVTAETIAHLSFRPRIVGVGQPVLLNYWLQSVTLGANYKYTQSYKITITDPDGTKEEFIKDSYVADATGWFEYIPETTGTYTIEFDFLGQFFPNGTYFEGVNYPSIAAIGPYTAGSIRCTCILPFNIL